MFPTSWTWALIQQSIQDTLSQEPFNGGIMALLGLALIGFVVGVLVHTFRRARSA